MPNIEEQALNRMHVRLDRSVPNPIKTPPHLFELPGVWCAVAKRGGGKSTAIASLLRDYKDARCMDRCWLISPNADSHVNKRLFEGIVKPEDLHQNPTWGSFDRVLEQLGEEADEYERYLSAKEAYAKLQAFFKRYRTRDPDRLPHSLLMQAYELGLFDSDFDLTPPPKYKYGDKHPCFFVVLDDVQGTNLMSPSTRNPVTNAAIRNRHLKKIGLTIIFLTQSYSAQSGLPPFIRANATLYLIWRLASEDTRIKLANELANDVDRTQFLKMYDHCTSDDEPHSFFCLDMQAPASRRFRKRFDTIVR